MWSRNLGKINKLQAQFHFYKLMVNESLRSDISIRLTNNIKDINKIFTSAVCLLNKYEILPIEAANNKSIQSEAIEFRGVLFSWRENLRKTPNNVPQTTTTAVKTTK